MAPPRPAWLQILVNDTDVEPHLPPPPPSKRVARATRLPPYDKDLQCKHCGKVFRRVCNYREHQRVHSNEYKFVCNVPGCNRKFMWRSSVQAHLRSHQAKLQRRRARSPIAKLPPSTFPQRIAALPIATQTLPRESLLANAS